MRRRACRHSSPNSTVIDVSPNLLVVFLLACTGLHAGVYADRYSARLDQLDISNPESVCTARTALHEELPNAPDADRTAMFRSFVSFFGRVNRATSRQFYQAINPLNKHLSDILKNWGFNLTAALPAIKADTEVHRALGAWFDCGFLLQQSEGIYDTGLDSASLVEFAPELSPDMSAWVIFRDQEDHIHRVIAGDASLAISWQELADRLQRWEEFLRQHPADAPESEPEIHFMAYIFFLGLANTPITTDNGRLDPEVLAAWRRFADRNPQSEYVSLIRMLTPALEKDGFRWTPSEDAMVAWVAKQREADVHAEAAKR